MNIVECTEKVESINSNEIELNILQINKTIVSNKLPNTKIGSHCKSPYQCDYFDNCRTKLPDFHVEQIPNQSKDLKQNLLALNITDIKKLPDM